MAGLSSREIASEVPLLSLRNVAISFETSFGEIPITRDVCFSISRGERVGLVGESGCGKTVTGLSIMGLLPLDVARVRGRIELLGQDLVSLPEYRMRNVRGSDVAMIFQEPMSALDPVFTVGSQITEAWLSHNREGTAAQARERAMHALSQVGIPLPARRFSEYPHQLSGGMRQRVMIAMAIICKPKLLIADEPTTALDVTVQAQIMDLLRDLSEETGTALLFITHDLGVVAETCTRLLTMYAGELVEDAPIDSVLTRPRHPYTSGLLRSLPRLSARHSRLGSIPGRVPSATDMPSGCRYRSRCTYAADGCELEQPFRATGDDAQASLRRARCVRADDLELEGAIGQ